MVNSIDGTTLQRLLKGGMLNLENSKELVNSLNVFPVPDGDTGTNMSLTIKSAVEQALTVNDNNVSKVMDAASLGSLMGARGNSGVILSQLFRGFAEGVKGYEQLTSTALAEGFRHAARVAYHAVMKPVEGTILTVAKDMSLKASKYIKSTDLIMNIIESILEEGERSLKRTPELLPQLKAAGVVDAGGKGLLIFLEGMVLTAKGQLDPDMAIEDIKSIAAAGKIIATEDIEFGYCTEFMIESDASNVAKLREKLYSMGDSLIVVGDQGVIKVHVHTDHPGEALEFAMSFGGIRNIKIDNMRYQHEEILRSEIEKVSDEQNTEDKALEEPTEYGIIAVASGDGLERVFKDLGVNVVIKGGQTMNPSTEDFIKAIDSINAKQLLIFPNNKNIVLAAEQAQKLSDKQVYVIKTKTIPQGISALLSFDPEAIIEENLDAIESAISNLRAGQVTYAVRDTELNGIDIKKDEIIGMSESDILTNGVELNPTAALLVDKLMFDDSTIISVIYGFDTPEEEAQELADLLESKYPDHDVVLIDGGQPVYYYLISID
ncbi:MAG: DAK2 domain-containing protein [Tissierellia bacterium]|nr:DAK2 domain-containing protein [Tissierellia bacterium]